jgi:class 3 adenylate cyclase
MKVATARLASYALRMRMCAQCGEDNPVRARFCLACGSPLAASGTGREVRKTVTVVFSDLVGSTPLGERLDPESLREVITRYYDRAAEVLVRHGGTVEKFIGDAVMAVYGIPRLHEDDALRAVRGAVELRQQRRRRMGVVGVRSFRPADRAAVRDISYRTGFMGESANPGATKSHGPTWTSYYTDQEPELAHLLLALT